MRLFENYSNSIKGILNSQSNVGSRSYTHVNEQARDLLTKGQAQGMSLSTSGNGGELVSFNKNALVGFFGQNPFAFPEPTIGDHPDFKHLEKGQDENFYCTSFFLDIKGSTRLAIKYDLHTVRRIKDALLSLSIGVVNFFGGHIQRLQGDALFAQFARKNKGQHINDSIIGALNAGAVLCNYVESDLASIFEAEGIEPLKIRIGIDTGDRDKVLWSRYGLALCGELTTTSLHTDLAAKLQHQAKNNGILVGRNVKDFLDLELKETNGFLEYVIDREGNKDYYIFDYNGVRYNKYSFDWKQYLLLHPLIAKDSDGNKLRVDEPRLKIKCFISPAGSNSWSEYHPRTFSIPKTYDIKFQIVYATNDQPFLSFDKKVEWKAFNGGKEAQNQTPCQREHNFDGMFKSRECHTTAAFLGHHYVQCKIIQEGDKGRGSYQIAKLTFPIFVQ